MQIKERAAAKVNLTLHVTGQRGDGYHLLDSLVVFADIGDEITVSKAQDLSLLINGPFATELGDASEDNLVLRAARLVSAGLSSPRTGARIELAKNLPIASGIGGGSADAAATLRALARLWTCDMPDAGAALSLGADVPVCLDNRPKRMRGIGEEIEPLAGVVPPQFILLVNPRVPVSTPAIFRSLVTKENSPMPETLPSGLSAQGFWDWLKTQRNDLEDAAIQLCPVIQDCLNALIAQNAGLARMSGSGATCFGLFETQEAAEAAARVIGINNPNWWVASGQVLSAI
jgi:4-diphosphocytidyl-2-C-methyl-D-erythritol kinase